MGWRVLAAAASLLHVVTASADGIFAPEVQSGLCDMSPYPFNAQVKEYSIACGWEAREVHLHVHDSNNYVTVYGPTGRTRGEGGAGQVVETRVLLFQAMLTKLTLDAFGGEYTVLFKLRKPPAEKVTSRAFVWVDEEEKRHQVIGRALPDINSESLPAHGIIQVTGQPFRNFDKCAYESGLQMQGDASSHTYWLHLNCKQGEVDLAQIVMFGRHLQSKDIKCELTSQCSEEKMKHNFTFETLTLAAKDPRYSAYRFKAWSGSKKGVWDTYQCPTMAATCQVGTQKLLIQMNSLDEAAVNKLIDLSPVVPHCMDPGLIKIEVPMSYDASGMEIPDQKCHGRGGGSNFMFFCPPTVDSVEVKPYIKDPSAIVMAYGVQQQKIHLYRDGTVSFSFKAPVGTMGCNAMKCERGPFVMDLVCGDQGSQYQVTVANPAGVHADAINFNPIGKLPEDCELTPSWHPHVFNYKLICKASPSFPIHMPDPSTVSSTIVEVKYKSHTRGEMKFTNSESDHPKEIFMRPAEKFDFHIYMISPTKGPEYVFHVQREGSVNLMFEPFFFDKIKEKNADGDSCIVVPDWNPQVHDYEINCTTGIKDLAFNLPDPDTVKGQVVQTWYESKAQGDEDWLSSDKGPTVLPMKLGETIKVSIAVEEPIEGPIYHFKINRNGGLLGADFTKKIAEAFQFIAPGLALMSGANFVTAIKFIQFMGIFNDMGGVPEAYGDFVDTFKSINFNFDPTTLLFSKEDLENMLMRQIAPAMGIGDDVKDLGELKKKYGKQYREIMRMITNMKKQVSEDAETISKIFMIPFLALLVILWHMGWGCLYRQFPWMRPQHRDVRNSTGDLPAAMPGVLLLLDLGLVGFCLTATDMLFKGGELDVFGLYKPDEEELHILMWGMVLLYPVAFLALSFGASVWMEQNLVYNESLGQFTDRECVEIAAREADEIPIVSSIPIVGGLVNKYWPKAFKLTRHINAVAPIKDIADEGEKKALLLDAPTGESELLDMGKNMVTGTCMKDPEAERKKKEEEEERKKKEAEAKALEDDDGPKYATVMLDSSAFRGETAVKIHKELARDVPENLIYDAESAPLALEDAPASTGRSSTPDEERPLIPGVSPSAFVYRLSGVYDKFPDAQVGRLNMRVPTVRGRMSKKERDEAGDDKKKLSYHAINELNAQVQCRDIPGLNWYVPNTVIQVPAENLTYKWASTYSHILKGQGKARYNFVFSRVVSVGSIFAVAVAGAAKDAGKSAMAAEEGAMEKEAEAAAEGAEKGVISQFMSYMFPTAALEQAGVLFAATFLNFYSAFKSSWEEVELSEDDSLPAKCCSNFGILLSVLMSGEVWIFFSELSLLWVLMISAKQFPLFWKPLGKEEISALVLIGFSAIGIFILNTGFFIQQGKKAYKYICEIKDKIPIWYAQAEQTYETWKMNITWTCNACRIICIPESSSYGASKVEREDLYREISASFKSTVGSVIPIDDIERKRNEYCCFFCINKHVDRDGWCPC
jgi:hypothetical protein